MESVRSESWRDSPASTAATESHCGDTGAVSLPPSSVLGLLPLNGGMLIFASEFTRDVVAHSEDKGDGDGDGDGEIVWSPPHGLEQHDLMSKAPKLLKL